jgi:hypothetical protein
VVLYPCLRLRDCGLDIAKDGTPFGQGVCKEEILRGNLNINSSYIGINNNSQGVKETPAGGRFGLINWPNGIKEISSIWM